MTARLALIALLVFGPGALGQSSHLSYDPLLADPLGSQALAKARFDASRASLEDLKRAKVSTSRQGEVAARGLVLRGVQGMTLDRLLAWTTQVAEDELADSPAPRDRMRLALASWDLALASEQIVEEKIRVGERGGSTVALLAARGSRLECEIRLTHARALAPLLDDIGIALTDPLGSLDQARRQADLAGKKVHDLERERWEIAGQVFTSVWELFDHGAQGVTTTDLAESALRVLEAEHAVRGADASRPAFLERSWIWAKWLETVVEAKRAVNAAGGDELSLWEARLFRLGWEVEWAQARPGQPTPARHLAHPIHVQPSPLQGEVGSALREPPYTDLATLRRTRQQIAVAAWNLRLAYFVTEQGGSDWQSVLDLSRQLAEADTDLAVTPEARAHALEKHWRRMVLLESVVEEKMRLGQRGGDRLSFLLVRRARQSLEIDLAQHK